MLLSKYILWGMLFFYNLIGKGIGSHSGVRFGQTWLEWRCGVVAKLSVRNIYSLTLVTFPNTYALYDCLQSKLSSMLPDLNHPSPFSKRITHYSLYTISIGPYTFVYEPASWDRSFRRLGILFFVIVVYHIVMLALLCDASQLFRCHIHSVTYC